jgi:hypothetical protein
MLADVVVLRRQAHSFAAIDRHAAHLHCGKHVREPLRPEHADQPADELRADRGMERRRLDLAAPRMRFTQVLGLRLRVPRKAFEQDACAAVRFRAPRSGDRDRRR